MAHEDTGLLDEDLQEEELEGLDDNPLYDALINQEEDQHEDEEDELDDEDLEPKEGDSPEVLRTKLAAQKRLAKQRGKSNQRLKDRVEELEKKLNGGEAGAIQKQDLADLVKAITGGKDEQESAEKEAARIQALKQRLEDDPNSIVEILAENSMSLENRLAGILRSRDAYWEEKLAEVRGNKAADASPEVMRVANLLKKRPEYQNLEMSTLIQIAKDLSPLAKRVSRRPPAPSDGGKVLPITATGEQVEKKYKSELDAMGYGSDED